ncbi:iron ABC transporter substrate-binding protein [Methanothermococcus sp. SCGC AD-155-C09]|nr:iron ABC transporter substrate-binding protein [Methanothermococcus sp. SCGC AD-155-C09]
MISKISKILLGVFSIVIILGMCGCIGSDNTNNQNVENSNTLDTNKDLDTIKVVDLYNREVEVPKNVNRIVCCGPGCLRLIVYLNATNKVVGVENSEKEWIPWGKPYRIANPELADLPTIGQGGPSPKPDPEAIIMVEPDVIFVTYMPKEEVEKLQERTGIPVVVLSYGKLATFNDRELFKSLELTGKILNKEKRAKDVINFINNTLKDLQERTKDIPEDEKPKVYMGGVGFKGARGIDSTMCKYPPFVAVNARNVAEELNREGHAFVSKEQILKWNPDVIFIDEGGLKVVLEDYRKNPEFYNSLKAFQSGEVYGLLPYRFSATNIGTALANGYYIGKVLYPDRFKDIDPEERADEIFIFLVGKPVYKDMKDFWGGFKKLNFTEE